jgi:enoyl-CoA hydratase/carnithine racemase
VVAAAVAIAVQQELAMSVRIAHADGCCLLELARPEKQNALTTAMYSELAEALRAAEADPAVHSVIIAGQPGIFTAGNDLADFLAIEALSLDAPPFRFMHALVEGTKPVIAAVDGAAIGIGATLLLHCDFVYLSDRSRLAFPFVALGLVPEFASSLLLPARIGALRANSALLLGEPLGAQQAVALGLANECLPPDEVLPRARATAARLAVAPAGAVVAARKLLRTAETGAVKSTIAAEAQVFAQRLALGETRAALRAILERRKGA